MTLAEQITLAQRLYPKEWAAAESLKGDKRRNRRTRLRKMALYQVALDALPQNARCETCKFWTKSMSLGRTCDLDSDYHGSTVTKPDHKCPRWGEKTNPAS